MWTYSTYTSAYINHEHRCDCPAHLFGMTPWDFLPQFSWVKSHPIHPDFLCNRCFEKHGQEWCKFDLEWALFKERLEVADKNMADSKLDAQVVFDGLVGFFWAKWRDSLKQGRTIAAADSPKRNIYVAMVVIRLFTLQNFMKSPRQVANSTNQHLGLYSSIKVHFQLKSNAENVICIHTCKQSRNFDTLWE